MKSSPCPVRPYAQRITSAGQSLGGRHGICYPLPEPLDRYRERLSGIPFLQIWVSFNLFGGMGAGDLYIALGVLELTMWTRLDWNLQSAS